MENLIYNDGKVIVFPISGEELEILSVSKQEFAKHINVNYVCEDFEPVENLKQRAQFLKQNQDDLATNNYWVIAKIDERAIVGYIVLTKDEKSQIINLQNYLSKNYSEEILMRANILLKMYEQEFDLHINFERYEMLNRE